MRGGANLLAGRAFRRDLFPLTWKEIKKFYLQKYLKFGGLPMSYFNEEPGEYLFKRRNTGRRDC